MIDFTTYKYLADLLRKYNYEYYVQNAPTVSDAVYDSIFRQVQEFETVRPQLKIANSPTSDVGGVNRQEFKTTKHLTPMLSIDTLHHLTDLQKFQTDCRLTLKLDRNPTLITEYKYDGVSLSLIYRFGKLVIARTRGDGVDGEDVTETVKTIMNIPQVLHNYEKYDNILEPLVEVRGEVIISKSDFAKLNDRLLSEGKATFVNPRNAASGSLRNSDVVEIAKRPLRFIAYYLNVNLNTQKQVLDVLNDLGFNIGDMAEITEDVNAVFSLFEYVETKIRNQLDYEIDGLVIKLNDLSHQQQLESRQIQQTTLIGKCRSVSWAKAIKFQPSSAITQLLDVEFFVGKTGVLTPVAKIKPVSIGGVIVENVNLYNLDEINRLGLTRGCLVEVERRGDVIPKIKIALSTTNTSLHIPKICPSCEGPLINTKSKLMCTALFRCDSQTLNKLVYFTSNNAMKIETLNGSTLNKLMEYGLVSTFDDLYFLTLEDIIGKQIPGVGKKSAAVIITEIEKSKSKPLHRFLAGLCIKHVGITTAINLCKAYKSLDELYKLTLDDLLNAKIENVGRETAAAVISYFKNPENINRLNRFKTKGISFENTVFKTNDDNKIKIAITGSFPRTREYMASILTKTNYEVVNKINRDTEVILVGHKPGITLQKAIEYGISCHYYNYGKPDNNEIYQLLF